MKSRYALQEGRVIGEEEVRRTAAGGGWTAMRGGGHLQLASFCNFYLWS